MGVQKGEIFGLLGPNGAGKTTLLRILLGYIQPTAGTAQVAGFDCVSESLAVREQTAYLPGESRLFRRMTGNRVLDFFSGLRLENRSWPNCRWPWHGLGSGRRQGLIGVCACAAVNQQITRPKKRVSGVNNLCFGSLFDAGFTGEVGRFGSDDIDGTMPTFRCYGGTIGWFESADRSTKIPQKLVHKIDAHLPTHPPATQECGLGAGS